MNKLSGELKAVINRHVNNAGHREILAITSALCQIEEPHQPSANVPLIQPRFEPVGDYGTRDNSTGLIWTRDTLAGGRMEWSKAKDACSKLALGGFSDWRLPTVKELLTLVDYERHDPAIDTGNFNCESAWYWSSTPLASSPGGCAWGVFFNGGGTNWSGRSYDGFVRAVRVGQF